MKTPIFNPIIIPKWYVMAIPYSPNQSLLDKFFAFSIFFQTLESPCLGLLWKKFWFCRYLFHTIRTQMFSFSVKIFHANLHWNAMFSAAILWRPSPLFSLGVHILPHATKAISFTVLLFSQKNSRFSRSIWVAIMLGSWKHCIVWAGKASRCDWIRTVCPALDKQLAFHPSSLDIAFFNNCLLYTSPSPRD